MIGQNLCGPRVPVRSRAARLLRRLRDCTSGIALTEFAFIAPVFLTLGVLGLDTANYIVTHMRVSQIAIHVADNSSRVGEHGVLVARKIRESDINDLLIGAERYAGSLDIQQNGRIIISSLEQNDDGGQWIHWQRCIGDLDWESNYGEAGDGASGTELAGMGRTGSEVTALPQDAVIFVEVAYNYTSLSPLSALDGNTITYTGAFTVRDARDLSQIYQTNPAAPVASCDQG